MSGENWIDYPDDGDRACIFGRRPMNAAEADHHLRTARRLVLEADDRIAELEAKVERLTSRGIEDMQHRIAELEAELDKLAACTGEPDSDVRYALAWIDRQTLSAFKKDPRGSAICERLGIVDGSDQ